MVFTLIELEKIEFHDFEFNIYFYSVNLKNYKKALAYVALRDLRKESLRGSVLQGYGYNFLRT